MVVIMGVVVARFEKGRNHKHQYPNNIDPPEVCHLLLHDEKASLSKNAHHQASERDRLEEVELKIADTLEHSMDNGLMN